MPNVCPVDTVISKQSIHLLGENWGRTMFDLLFIASSVLVIFFVLAVTFALVSMCDPVDILQDIRQAPWLVTGLTLGMLAVLYLSLVANSLDIASRTSILLFGILGICVGAWLNGRGSSSID